MQKFEDGDINLSTKHNPVCPYCGKENDFWRYGERSGIYDDSGPCELECSHCDNRFQCQPEISYRFTTFVKSIDGDED